MENEQSSLQLVRRLFPHIEPKRRIQFGFLFPLMVFASFAEVVSLGAVLPFLGVLTAPERIFEHTLAQPLIQILNLTEPKQLLLPLTLAFAAAATFAGATRFSLLWAQTRFGHGIGADFSFRIYRHTLYQEYKTHVNRNSSEVIAGITFKANSLVNGVIMPLLNIFSSLLILITILGALIAIEPFMACAVLVGASFVYGVIIVFIRKQIKRDSDCISREQNQVLKALQEGLSGIRDVLIDGTQAIYCKIYRDADIPLRHSLANVQIISTGPRFVIEAIGMLMIAAIAFSLASRPDGISAAIPVLGAFALGAQRLLPVLQQIYASFSQLQAGKSPMRDALNLLEQPLPAHANTPVSTPIVFQECIKLNDVGFRYSKETPWVLQNLNLVISKGSRIGFIGPTGGGKSTLLDIVMGLLQPTSGALEIDGVAIEQENHRSWQMHIAHVPQAIFLADTSIAENIAFGIPIEKIDYELVRSAAAKAQIADTIENWESGYETKVGERGVRLSGGQRQRIGIARALYKQADVIVFDEATSALDSETELAVMRAIESLSTDLTILIVAHRLSTLINCDRLVELSNGSVSKYGSYAEVVRP